MMKGSCPGVVKRVLTLRKSLRVPTSRRDLEKVSTGLFLLSVHQDSSWLFADQPQVDRHQLQVWSRPLPDAGGEECVPWSDEDQGLCIILHGRYTGIVRHCNRMPTTAHVSLLCQLELDTITLARVVPVSPKVSAKFPIRWSLWRYSTCMHGVV